MILRLRRRADPHSRSSRNRPRAALAASRARWRECVSNPEMLWVADIYQTRNIDGNRIPRSTVSETLVQRKAQDIHDSASCLCRLKCPSVELVSVRLQRVLFYATVPLTWCVVLARCSVSWTQSAGSSRETAMLLVQFPSLASRNPSRPQHSKSTRHWMRLMRQGPSAVHRNTTWTDWTSPVDGQDAFSSWNKSTPKMCRHWPVAATSFYGI
jgi:hypothetical protein